MQKNIKATGFELTPAISDYIDKRFAVFDRYVGENNDSARCDVEVAKTTRHHKHGDVFKAEVHLVFSGKNFFASCEKEDLYAAIDIVRDEIVRSLSSNKDKGIALMRKGALAMKNALKGLDVRTRFKKR